MRKRWWRLHSWLGLIAGLGLLVIGLTGSLLVFRDQIDGLVAPQLTRVQITPEGRLSWDRLLAAAQQAWPDFDITGFGPRRDPALADLVYLKSREQHELRVGTLNPDTGQALSSPLDPARTITGLLLELHYTWFADNVGMLVIGLLAVLLCLLGLTGLWLYRDFWRHFFTLRWRRSARIFFSDLHKMVGISSVGFNLILGFTGAYWNLTHVAAEGLRHSQQTESKVSGRLYAESISLEKCLVVATEHLPGFQTNWVSLPSQPGAPIMLFGKVPTRNPFRGDYGSNASFDAQTGELKAVVDLRQAGLWTKITDSFVPLHFGTFGGWTIKILWSLGGLAPGVLGVSGFLIWRARRRRPGSATQSPAKKPQRQGSGPRERRTDFVP